jgi:hypothetical protein
LGSDYLIPLLDLLIPRLLAGNPAPAPMPHLERWLARADVERSPERSAEAWLARRFGLEGLPVAPVALAVDEAPQPGHWLRADPVYARVERDTLVLHPGSILAIEPDEARELVASLRELFAPDGIEWHVPRPDRWYARVPPGELPETTPLAEALGQDVFRRLPHGTGRINWPSAMTEIQMLFSTHAVNLAREAARRPPINCVWFWGGGCLPARLESPYRVVYAADPFAAGLAHLSSARAEPPPQSPAALGAGALVVLDEPTHALDSAWFAGLGATIASHGGVRVVLPSVRDTCVATLTGAARWRILRRVRPLGAYA